MSPADRIEKLAEIAQRRGATDVSKLATEVIGGGQKVIGRPLVKSSRSFAKSFSADGEMRRR